MQPLLTNLPMAVRFAILILGIAMMAGVGGKIRSASNAPDTSSHPVKPVYLELAWGQQRAERLIESWGTNASERLRVGLYWDFLFIPAYVAVWVVLCGFLATALATVDPAWARWGVELGYAGLVAGALDVVENVGLLRELEPTPTPGWIQVASLASSVKWLLVAAALVYLLLGWIKLLRGG